MTDEKTIAQLDAEFDADLEKARQETKDNPPKTEQVVEPTTKDAPNPVKAEENPPKTATDKAAYAFEELRRKEREAKAEAEKVKKELEEMNELARSSGYSSAKELKEAWQRQVDEAEAKKRNVDPKVYAELTAQKREIDELKRKNAEGLKVSKLREVSNEVESFRAEYNLTQDEVTSLLNVMEEDGYTTDMLISQPIKATRNTLKGYAADILLEREVQKKLGKATPKVPDEKLKNTSADQDTDPLSDDAIAKELGAFYKNKEPWRR